MSSFEENFKNKVKFIDRPIVDFMHCIYLYANLDETIEHLNDMGFTFDKYMLHIINSIEGNLSMFIKNELHNLSKLSIADCIVIAFVSDYKEINTIEDFFEVLDKVSIEKLFDYIGGLFLSSYLPNLNKDWGNVRHSIPKMKEYISKLDEIEPSLKSEIMELYESTEETKMRIRYVVDQFYNKGYKQFEDEILAKSKKEKFRYIELLNEDPNKFLEINLKNCSINENIDLKDCNMYVSYMQQIGSMFLNDCNLENSTGTISIGCRNIDFFNKKSIVANFQKFLKTISDPTRFKIITLVGQKSWYVQALAKELELTPSTIHHHLETLNMLDIVTSYKEQNKVMYKLNNNVTKQYIKLLTDKIVKE